MGFVRGPSRAWHCKRPVECPPVSGGLEARRKPALGRNFFEHTFFAKHGGKNEKDLLAVDHSARASMKDAASCEK